MTDLDSLLTAAALLLLVGVVGSKAATRLGVPALLLFLGIGMLAGSEGLGGIEFTSVGLARDIGIVALAFILFSGGFDTEWRVVRPVLLPGVLLATVGVAITASVVGVIAAAVLDLPWQTGLLLGAIVSSTDAAAVFSVLRSRALGLKGPLRPLLELESGSNDPMAAFLTIGMLELIAGDLDAGWLFPQFVMEMAIGALAGLLLARLAVELINRLRLEYEGLYPVATLALVGLVYGFASLLGGSGFLAAYVAGLVIGNSHVVHKRSLARFHDAVAWLGQIVMFLVLGLLVFPSRVWEVAVPALLVAVALIFLGRPLAVWLSLLPLRLGAGFRGGERLGARETTLVSWVGLRGAVPIILATFPLGAGIEGANTIFHVVFFVVIISVLVQGTTIPSVARLLKVDAPPPADPAYPIESVAHPDAPAALHEVPVPERSAVEGARVFELGLPSEVLIVLIDRGGEVIVPRGATEVHVHDKLMVLTGGEGLEQVRALVAPG